MSMYAKYAKEYEDLESIHTDKGFINYKFVGTDICYITVVYVEPEFRNQNVATDMAKRVEKIAFDRGCKTLIGSVDERSNNPTQSMKVLLAYGFDYDSIGGSLLYFKKNIDGGL